MTIGLVPYETSRIAFKKASNGSLAYDLLSLINLQVKCNLPILRYNTNILMNSLGLKKKTKKKNESVLCTFLSLFGFTTLLFSLTAVQKKKTVLLLVNSHLYVSILRKFGSCLITYALNAPRYSKTDKLTNAQREDTSHPMHPRT